MPEWLKDRMEGRTRWLVPEVSTLGRDEGEALAAALAPDATSDVVLDLSSVDLMTSPAIGAVIVMHKRLSVQGGRLVLTNLSPMLQETLSFLKLDHVLTLCTSAEELKRALRPH